MRISALPFLLSGALIAAAGCGGSGKAPNPAARMLQRKDLVSVSRALKSVEYPIAGEVAAAKTAWPLVVNGISGQKPSVVRPPVAAAAASIAKLKAPSLLEEPQATSLTGPGAELAGLFRDYSALSGRGWELITADLDQIQHGSPAAARFARENIALYIDSVYDGQFTLAQIGKKLMVGYKGLGGPAAFGTTLSQEEVNALANAYSEPADRLQPHVGVRLGS